MSTDQVVGIASAAEGEGGNDYGKAGKGGKVGGGGVVGEGGFVAGGDLSIAEVRGGEADGAGMNVDGGNGVGKKPLLPGTPVTAAALRVRGDPKGAFEAFPVGNGKGKDGGGGIGGAGSMWSWRRSRL